MGSVLQGDADEIVLQIMVLRIATDARQIMLSQEFCDSDSFLLLRLIHKIRVLAADLLCNTVKTTGHLGFLATIADYGS